MNPCYAAKVGKLAHIQGQGRTSLGGKFVTSMGMMIFKSGVMNENGTQPTFLLLYYIKKN